MIKEIKGEWSGGGKKRKLEKKTISNLSILFSSLHFAVFSSLFTDHWTLLDINYIERPSSSPSDPARASLSSSLLNRLCVYMLCAMSRAILFLSQHSSFLGGSGWARVSCHEWKLLSDTIVHRHDFLGSLECTMLLVELWRDGRGSARHDIIVWPSLWPGRAWIILSSRHNILPAALWRTSRLISQELGTQCPEECVFKFAWKIHEPRERFWGVETRLSCSWRWN